MTVKKQRKLSVRFLFYGTLVFAYAVLVCLKVAGIMPENTAWGLSNIIFSVALIGFGVDMVLRSKK